MKKNLNVWCRRCELNIWLTWSNDSLYCFHDFHTHCWHGQIKNIVDWTSITHNISSVIWSWRNERKLLQVFYNDFIPIDHERFRWLFSRHTWYWYWCSSVAVVKTLTQSKLIRFVIHQSIHSGMRLLLFALSFQYVRWLCLHYESRVFLGSRIGRQTHVLILILDRWSIHFATEFYQILRLISAVPRDTR